jgi:acetyl-CoA acetyltransferase
MPNIKDKTCIVGIGWTKFGSMKRPLPESQYTLACRAIMAAIDDAGLRPRDIDGIMRFSFDSNDPIRIADSLGLNLRFFGKTMYGGGGGCACVAQAAAAVNAGLATHVVAFRALSQSQEVAFGHFASLFAEKFSERKGVPGPIGWAIPFGLMSPAQGAALTASRHFHLYGTTSDHLANIALAERRHANRNPDAFFYDRPMTRDDYMNSPMISTPLHLYDCCQESDGACAVIVTSTERAKDLKQPPVYIMAAAQAGMWYPNHALILDKIPEIVQDETWQLAEALYGMSGITPSDVDVAEIYDHFTIHVLCALESFGFCKRGEGGPFTEGGRLEWPDGDLPLNTSGGHLSEAYIHGLNLIVDGVRQLRGTAPAQVRDAEIVLCASGNAVPTSGIILRR